MSEGLEVSLVTANASHILEERRGSLISGYIGRVLEDPQLEGLRKISNSELQGLVRYTLTSLSDCLEGDEEEVGRCFDFMGNTCGRLSIPILEASYALYILRDRVIEVFASDRAPEEVKTRASGFFDRLVLELLRRD